MADSCNFSTGSPILVGVPFNDAYRYLHGLLTVRLIFVDIILALNLDDAIFGRKSRTLALSYALRMVSGYFSELVVTGLRVTDVF